MLSHEKLHVYQRSIAFLALAVNLMDKLPRGHGEISDQLRRAAMSIPLNIAEASGRTGSRDNAKFFSIARGSALECGAILDVCRVLKVIENEVFTDGKDHIRQIVAMLTRLCLK